jgi:predicted O-methyltransferase YrrM
MKFSEILPALLRRFRFFWKARTRYDIHSPLVAGLVEAVLEDRRHYYAFFDVEVARNKWLADETMIHLPRLGAGSTVSDATQRRAGDILRSTAVSPETGRRLFRLALWLQPKNILELGASMGISTAYLAAADTRMPLLSIEGNKAVAGKAQAHLNELGLHQVELISGLFDEQLPAALAKLDRLGLLFIDGDHRREAVMKHVRTCLNHRHNDSVFVIADIHWSDDMEQAWSELCALPEVTLSVDFFHFGVLFFKKEIIEKQHFVVVPAHWKPWRMGFFAGG